MYCKLRAPATMSRFSSSRGLLYSPPPKPEESTGTNDADRPTDASATGAETLEADD